MNADFKAADYRRKKIPVISVQFKSAKISGKYNSIILPRR